MKGKHLNIFNKYFNFDTLNFYIRYSFYVDGYTMLFFFVLNRRKVICTYLLCGKDFVFVLSISGISII